MTCFPNPYPLDNQHPRSTSHHQRLSELWDRWTGLRTRELLDLRGKRCLEVGAGAGSYAIWLAGQVGAAGHVLAVDIDTGLLVQGAGPLEVRTRDISALPLTDLGMFDFIHARLVLCHLPAREKILAELVTLLNPQGVVLIEDWDTSNTRIVEHCRIPAHRHLYDKVQDVMSSVFTDAGTDRRWAHRIHGELMDLGLTDVQTPVHAEYWAGGSEGCLLVAGTVRQLWTDLKDRGVTETEASEVVRLLEEDGLFVLRGHLMHSTSARKPAQPADEDASTVPAAVAASPVAAGSG